MLFFFVVLVVIIWLGCFGFNNVYNFNEWDFEGYIWDKDIMLVDFYVFW